jgi:hypothetical protein
VQFPFAGHRRHVSDAYEIYAIITKKRGTANGGKIWLGALAQWKRAGKAPYYPGPSIVPE